MELSFIMAKKNIVVSKDLVEIHMKRELVEVLLNSVAQNYTVKGLEGAKVLMEICNSLSEALNTDGA